MFKTEEAVSQVSYPTFAIEESELRFDMAETIINQ